MSKRVLSLFLALVMLVLAVPVFALPTLADEAVAVNPTVEFRVGSAASKDGKGDIGTIVKYPDGTSLAQAQLPTTADLTAAGLDYKASDIITWAWWSTSDGKFYDIKDLKEDSSVLAGFGVTDASTLLFYPVFKESTSKAGVNNFYWEQQYTDETNTTKAISPVIAYRGGWSIGIYGNSVATYHVASEVNTDGIVTKRSISTNAWAAGGRFTTGNIVSGYNVAPTVLSYQAMADGRITVSIPVKAANRDYFVAVARNGVKVWPATTAGGKYTPSTKAEIAKWQSIPTTTAAGTPDYTVSLSVSKGDVIHVMYEGLYEGTSTTPSTAQISAFPTIQYTEFITGTKVGFALASGSGDVVTPFLYSSADSLTFPTDADLAAAGSTLKASDIMGWYAYDPSNGRFINVMESKNFGFPNGTTFFPITWESGFNATSNSLLYDAEDYTTPGNFRGGWTMGGFESENLLDGYAYKDFDVTHGYKSGYILSRTVADYEWYFGGLYARSSQIMAINANRTITPALTWAVLADGTVDITVPVPATNTSFAIAINNTYIYPAALSGQTVGVPNANDKANFANNSTVSEAVTVSAEVKAQDKIHFLIVGCNGGTQSTTNFFPSVTYQEEGRGTPVAYSSKELYVTETKANRPIVPNTSGETVTYVGGWDYTTYASLSALASRVDTPLFKRITGTGCIVSANGTSHNTSANAALMWGSIPGNTPVSAYWPAGAFSFNTKGTVASTRYIAEYTGTVKVSYTTLGNWQDGTSANTHTYAICVNGVQVWPVSTGEETAAWYTLSYNGTGDNAATYATNYAEDANKTMPGEITVKKGDSIEFVISCSPELTGAWWSRGNIAEGRVVYTSIDTTPVAEPNYVTSMTENRPTNPFAQDGNSAIVYPGAWDYIFYDNKSVVAGNNPDPFTTYYDSNANPVSCEGWLLREGKPQTGGYIYWNHAFNPNKTGMWVGQAMGFAAPTQVLGTRYTAEHNGMAKISFSILGNWGSTAQTPTLTHSYAIYVNGVQVWPVSTGDEAADWYTIYYCGEQDENGSRHIGEFGVNYADTLNATMPDALYLKKGDTVEFLVQGAPEVTNMYKSYGNMVEGKVEYTSIIKDLPSTQAGIAIGGSLAIYGQAADIHPDATEYGIYLNGQKIVLSGANAFDTKVDAKDGSTVQTIQSYYVVDGKTVLGDKKEVTVNGMLNDYAASGNETIKAAAEATLNYTAAAEAYFDDEAEDPAEIVAPAGKDAYVEKSESIGVAEYTGEDKIEFRGISLLLNDLINIKIVVDGTLPEGATLQISKSASFDELETLISGKATDDETGTKFIMDGISAQNWNTDYYIRVVDADKNVISDTLCYSVAAYYGRMIDRAEASDKLKAVISSLMNLYEAVSAN